MLRYAFLGALPEPLRDVREAPALISISLVLLAVLCTGMGLLLVPAVRGVVLDPAVAALSQGLEYARSLMAGL